MAYFPGVVSSGQANSSAAAKAIELDNRLRDLLRQLNSADYSTYLRERPHKCVYRALGVHRNENARQFVVQTCDCGEVKFTEMP